MTEADRVAFCLQLRGKAEAKELPFSFFRERKGILLTKRRPFLSQALSNPTARERLLRYAQFYLALSRLKFVNLMPNLTVTKIRRSIFVLDEALLNLATGVTSSVMTEPNLKATKYRAKRQAARKQRRLKRPDSLHKLRPPRLPRRPIQVAFGFI